MILEHSTRPTRIVLADDHPVVRLGVRAALTQDANFVVVGEASEGEGAVAVCVRERPDMLILDLSMPATDMETLVAEVRGHLPGLRILILTAHNDVNSIRRAMKAKVSGYLLKDEVGELLLSATKSVASGGAWFSQSVAHKMMQGLEDGGVALDLTPREKQLLERISRGLSNQVIAEELHLSEQTIRNYCSTLYDKIGVRSRAEAVVWARERDLL